MEFMVVDRAKGILLIWAIKQLGEQMSSIVRLRKPEKKLTKVLFKCLWPKRKYRNKEIIREMGGCETYSNVWLQALTTMIIDNDYDQTIITTNHQNKADWS